LTKTKCGGTIDIHFLKTHPMAGNETKEGLTGQPVELNSPRPRTAVDQGTAAARSRLENPKGALAVAQGSEAEELAPEAIVTLPTIQRLRPEEVAGVDAETVLLDGDYPEDQNMIIEVDGVQFSTPQNLTNARAERRATGAGTIDSAHGLRSGQKLVAQPGKRVPKIVNS
jgi:hypothetical protein